MEPLLLLTGFIAFPVALLILYLYLMHYYSRIREEWVFYGLVLGMFMGMLGGVIHLWVGPAFIFIVPVFDVMFLTVVLNSSKLQGKRKTVYYGCSMGIGYGAMVLVVYGYLLFFRSENVMADGFRYTILSFPFMLTYGGVGAYVGEGAGIGRLWAHSWRAIAIFMPFFFFVDMLSYAEGMVIVVPVGAMLVYGLTVYKYVSESVLPLGMLRKPGPRRKVRRSLWSR